MNQKTAYRIGRFWIRLISALIDYILVLLFVNLIIRLFVIHPKGIDILSIPLSHSVVAVTISLKGVILSTLFLGVLIIYSTLLEASKLQGTLGKYFTNHKVVNNELERIGLKKSLLRNMAKLFSIFCFGLGLVHMFRDQKRRTWHDLISGTLVIANNHRNQELPE